MLEFKLTSETFERLLFKFEPEFSTARSSPPAVLATFKAQVSRKTNIIIVSNGVEQNKNTQRRKRYVFSDDQISEQKSEAPSFTHQKKHLIKKQSFFFYSRQKKEDPDYSVKKQKNDRNVISNIIHHLMKHCLTAVSDEMFRKILEKKKINISIEELRHILQEKEKICKTYITNKHLQQLWFDHSKPQFSKAMRIISHIFLQNFSFLTIFNGNKLNRESKAIHYKGRRDLLQFLSKLK